MSEEHGLIQGAIVLVIFFRVEVRPTKREDFIKFIDWDIEVAQKSEQGTLLFALYQDPKDVNAFFVYEAYRDKIAFEAHKQNKPYQRWISEIQPEMVTVFQLLFEGEALCSITR